MLEVSVGVRELKAHLSQYLRELKQGKVIIITEHGKPVGRLMPAAQSVEEKTQALIEAGVVHWNGEKLPPVQPVATWRGPKSIADLISEDRE